MVAFLYWVKYQTQHVKGEIRFLISRKYSCIHSFSSTQPCLFNTIYTYLYFKNCFHRSYIQKLHLLHRHLIYYWMIIDFFQALSKPWYFKKELSPSASLSLDWEEMIWSCAMGSDSRQTLQTDHILKTPWG